MAVAVWTDIAPAPHHLRKLHAWGVSEHVSIEELESPIVLHRLVGQAAFGVQATRIRNAVLDRVEPAERRRAGELLQATFSGLAVGHRSAANLARRMYRSRASLDRDMRRAGLATPGRFIRGVRMGLVVLLRTDPVTRAGAWKALRFPTLAGLSNQVKAHFGHTLRALEQMEDAELLRLTVERLLTRARS